MSYKFIGENLRTHRKKSLKTLDKLSLEVGTSKGYLHDLESGRVKNPSATLMLKISDALSINIHDFFEKESLGEK